MPKQLTLGMNDLTNGHNVLMIERAQVLDLPQSCQWKALIRHLVHDHVELLQRIVLDLPCLSILILSLVHLPKRALSDFFDLVKITQSKPISLDRLSLLESFRALIDKSR